MIIHWTPSNSRYPAKWSQPKPDVIRCDWHGKIHEADFSGPGVVYEVPEDVREVVHQAWRDREGVLNLLVPTLSRGAQVDVVIDHGETGEISSGGASIDGAAERKRIEPILRLITEDAL